MAASIGLGNNWSQRGGRRGKKEGEKKGERGKKKKKKRKKRKSLGNHYCNLTAYHKH